MKVIRDFSNRINEAKEKRLEYQSIGRSKVKESDPLYVAGCMLYWGEGSKDANSVKLTNSELPMLLLFKNFLKIHFDIKDSEFIININCYTDTHSLQEIENYWINGLDLGFSSLRKSTVNCKPKSSKSTKVGKCEYGTCVLIVHKTKVVQEIYGAIQEFGKFDNLKWLTRVR